LSRRGYRIEKRKVINAAIEWDLRSFIEPIQREHIENRGEPYITKSRQYGIIIIKNQYMIVGGWIKTEETKAVNHAN